MTLLVCVAAGKSPTDRAVFRKGMAAFLDATGEAAVNHD